MPLTLTSHHTVKPTADKLKSQCVPTSYGPGAILGPHFCRGNGTFRVLKWYPLQIALRPNGLYLNPKGQNTPWRDFRPYDMPSGKGGEEGYTQDPTPASALLEGVRCQPKAASPSQVRGSSAGLLRAAQLLSPQLCCQ